MGVGIVLRYVLRRWQTNRIIAVMAALNLEKSVTGTGNDLAKSPKVPVGFTQIPETRFPESDDDTT